VRAALIAPLLILPAAAQAVCPTAADLDRGILLYTLGGDTELFRRVSDDVVRSTYLSGEEGSEALLGQGIYVLDNVALADGEVLPETQIHFDFPMTSADMPEPAPETDWTVDVTVEEAGYSEREHQSYSFGPLTRIGLGRCSYEMIQVRQTYSPDPYEVTDYVNWIPALGLSYLVQSSHAHGEDHYVYTAIEAVR